MNNQNKDSACKTLIHLADWIHLKLHTDTYIHTHTQMWNKRSLTERKRQTIENEWIEEKKRTNTNEKKKKFGPVAIVCAPAKN